MLIACPDWPVKPFGMYSSVLSHMSHEVLYKISYPLYAEGQVQSLSDPRYMSQFAFVLGFATHCWL